MNCNGWTLSNSEDITEARINNYIYRGAKFIVISDNKYLKLESLKKYLINKIGEYNGIMFYKL